MKVDTTKRSATVRNLFILQFLLELRAAISGALLVLGPDGHLMQMPLLILRTTPFTTFLLPGLLLFFFVGIFALAVAYSLFARPSWTCEAAGR